MPDILDAAQKQIDDAATQVGSPPPSPPTPPSGENEMPSVSRDPGQEPKEEKPVAPVTPPVPESEQTQKATGANTGVVDVILNAAQEENTPSADPPPPPPPPASPSIENANTPPPEGPQKPKTGKGPMLFVLFLFLVTLPVTVLFVRQQRQLADVRSRATVPTCRDECLAQGNTPIECSGFPPCSPTPGSGPTCRDECLAQGNTPIECSGFPPCATPTPTPPSGGSGTAAHAPKAGGKCTQNPQVWGDYSKFPIDPEDCEYAADGETFRTCYQKYKAAGCQAAPANPQDDLGCAKVTRRLATKYGYPSYECGAKAKELAVINCTNAMGVYERWCLGTVSPTPAPQCKNLKVYKDNEVVDPSTLRPGDDVVLAVKGTGGTKGRIRVNGGTFEETTTKNANDEFVADFTIPSGVSNFTIEAEVFIDGAWR